MPTVPKAKRSNISRRPLTETPISEQPVALPTGQAGRAVTEFAGQLYDTAKKEADRVKLSGFRSEVNNWEAEFIHGKEGLKQSQGEDAFQIRELLADGLKSKKAELLKTANGATQRRMLDELFAQREESTGRWANSHIDTQISVMQDKAYTAELDATKNLALQSRDLATALNSVHSSVVEYYTAKGFTGNEAVLNKELRRQDTILVKAYTDQLVSEGNSVEALEILKQTTGIDMEVKNKLLESAEKGASNETARKATDSVLFPYSRNKPTDIMLLGDLRRDIKKQNLKPEVEKIALAMAAVEVATHDSDKKKIEAEYESAVTAMIDKDTPIAEVENTFEFIEMTSTQQRTARTYAKRQANGEDFTETNESYDQWQRLMVPEELKYQSEDQLRALVPYLGKGRVTSLLTAKRGLEEFDTSKVGLLTKTFNRIAEMADLNPYGKQTDKEKQALGAFYGQVITVLVKEQEDKGSRLREGEIIQIMKDEFKNEITLRSGFFGFSRETKPLFRATPEERRNIYIPSEDRSVIIREYKQEGLSFTEQDIRDAYMLKHNRR